MTKLIWISFYVFVFLSVVSTVTDHYCNIQIPFYR